jgi:hypothetical protein
MWDEWPFYSNKSTHWAQSKIVPVSISTAFSLGNIPEQIEKVVTFRLMNNKIVNAPRLSGLITLCKDISLRGFTSVVSWSHSTIVTSRAFRLKIRSATERIFRRNALLLL